ARARCPRPHGQKPELDRPKVHPPSIPALPRAAAAIALYRTGSDTGRMRRRSSAAAPARVATTSGGARAGTVLAMRLRDAEAPLGPARRGDRMDTPEPQPVEERVLVRWVPSALLDLAPSEPVAGIRTPHRVLLQALPASRDALAALLRAQPFELT